MTTVTFDYSLQLNTATDYPTGLTGFVSWDKLVLLLNQYEVRDNERLTGIHISDSGISLILDYKR